MFQTLLKKKLLPAVTLPDADSALRVAEALLEGGLNVMEVTFRTSAATAALTAVAKEFPEMKIGAGTILSPEQVSAAKDAGAQFGLAPGLNISVIRAAKELEFAFIPGVATPSEIETALELGCKMLKLFPVSTLGGTDYLHSLQGPYHHTGVKFLAMGGIKPSNLKQYLENEMVAAAGGSWMTSQKAIADKNFSEITEQVRKSAKII
ncbi:MAG: bifunctional 4-hydroxy-2-oxoglutarate aldolase/2-dehydro-3-deoxy-phosphogluconate aldolase [Balneolaceae bacterium]